ncbi:MAG: DoxX family protein [Polyangiaceae bacterium]
MTTTFADSHAAIASASHDNARNVVRESSRSVSKAALWGGRVASALAVLFLAFDATLKLTQNPMALQGTVELGYPVGVIFGLGVVEAACLALYLMPRTAVLGAVLWTGYLGGAIATHVRLDNPLFTHVLFPTYVALLLWGGLWLRDPRIRALFPLRRAN